MNVKFYTDKTVNHDYLLIKLIDYINPKNKQLIQSKKEVIIDVGVYDLKKSNEYSWINKINFVDILDNLNKNEYIPFDYPSDMNPFYQDKFIFRTIENTMKYCYSSQFIVSIQYRNQDIYSFKYWFDMGNKFIVNNNILGLGNMCRLKKKTNFIRNTFKYTFKHSKAKRIHIFGLSIWLFPIAYILSKIYNKELSFDSTNWTRACNKKLKDINLCSMKSTRQLYFDTYLTRINKISEYIDDNWNKIDMDNYYLKIPKNLD